MTSLALEVWLDYSSFCLYLRQVTKCTFISFGPTGNLQITDHMCVLPLNIVNEKTYILLWLVYVSMAVVCGIFFIVSIVLCLV